MEAEAVGTTRAADIVSYAREILRALGVPATAPTLIGTDNLANQRVASGEGSPTKSKHFLRRYFVLKQRIASSEVIVRHVPDEHMPADFLTKWLRVDKLERSLKYVTGSTTARSSEAVARQAAASVTVVEPTSTVSSHMAHAARAHVAGGAGNERTVPMPGLRQCAISALCGIDRGECWT